VTTPQSTETRTQAAGERAPAAAAALPPARRRLDLGAWAPVFFFVLLVVVFGIVEPDDFLSTNNLKSILNNGAILAILACGLTVVLLTGEFDLSVAAAASFGGALSAVLVANADVSTGIAVTAVVAAGVLIGVVNGTLVTYFRIPALIVTLAVASILDGLTQLLTNNEIIFEGFSQSYLDIGGWTLGGLQAGVFYLVVIAVALWVVLRYTATGRHLYAVGGNREASRMAGIRVNRHIILAFGISGLLGALAGLVYASRQGSLSPLFGTSFLLPAFAAAFLGSVTLRRSEFHILGTVIGVYLIGTGTTGLLIIGGPTYTQQLFAGAVLILATAGSRLLGGGTGIWRRGFGFARRAAGEPAAESPPSRQPDAAATPGHSSAGQETRGG
jgi:ribose transport system permease protein